MDACDGSDKTFADSEWSGGTTLVVVHYLVYKVEIQWLAIPRLSLLSYPRAPWVAEGPTDSELHMMSDGDGAGGEVASPKVTPSSSSRKQSKASRIAAALQGALAHVTGKPPAVLTRCQYSVFAQVTCLVVCLDLKDTF